MHVDVELMKALRILVAASDYFPARTFARNRIVNVNAL
jgi:hypothetical protein